MCINPSKMWRIICNLVAFFLVFEVAIAIDPMFDDRKIQVNCSTVYVDQSGNGNFKTIQAAIDSVPQNNSKWICININQGVYRERVTVPPGKSYIYLVGKGQKNTYIVSDGTTPLYLTATFDTQADNIIAEGISFNNSYNAPGSSNPRLPAVAAKIEGDKTAFYRCGFYGLQDTIWDSSGRHYFKQCTIQGGVDFIFGGGQSIYEKCSIQMRGDQSIIGPGYITAQGRENPNDSNGFVFKYCAITGNANTYLGRPWRKYARVVFYKTCMVNIIVPQGWDPYIDRGGNESLMTFIESGCTGEGSKTSQRAQWQLDTQKKFSPQELKRLISINYINGGDWIKPDRDNTILLSRC